MSYIVYRSDLSGKRRENPQLVTCISTSKLVNRVTG